MAIGQSLPSPEVGWRRYDDTEGKIAYLGGTWSKSGSSSNWYNSYNTYSSNSGAYLVFKFYGTKLRVISTMNSGFNSGIPITIDDLPTEYYNTDGPLKPFTVCYEKTDLPLGIHTVTVFKDYMGSSMKYWDAIDIDDTGYLVAQIGQALTSPEPGWRRYDEVDENLIFSTGWLNYANASYHNGNVRYTDIVGEAVEFKFYGTQLRMLSVLATDRSSEISIIIDDIPYVLSQYSATTIYQGLFFEVCDLQRKVHAVKLITTDVKKVSIDAIEMDETGYLVDPQYTGVSIEGVFIAKTDVWYMGNEGDIELRAGVTHDLASNVRLDASINGNQFYSTDEFLPTPFSINTWIPRSFLDSRENVLELVAQDEDIGYARFEYVIIKEDLDTFHFVRRLDFKEDYITDSNVEVSLGKGASLQSAGYGTIEFEISTMGKSKLNSVIPLSDVYSLTSLIPKMSSNSQDGYELSSSTLYTTNGPAWKAFDDSVSGGWLAAISSDMWLQIKLNKLSIVLKYTMMARNASATYGPRTWTFEGSLDGVNWDILDTQIDVPAWLTLETREYIINNTKSYLYYRIYFTQSHGTSYMGVEEVELYGPDLSNVLTEELTFENEMDYAQDLGTGRIYRYRLLTEFSDVKNILVVQDGDSIGNL